MDIDTLPQAASSRNPEDRRRRILAFAEALFELLAPIDAGPSPSDMMSEVDAAKYAVCSRRTISDARRRGELTAYGSQKERAYRRADLDKWIESRRVVHKPLEDDDIEKRVQRLARSGGR